MLNNSLSEPGIDKSLYPTARRVRAGSPGRRIFSIGQE